MTAGATIESFGARWTATLAVVVVALGAAAAPTDAATPVSVDALIYVRVPAFGLNPSTNVSESYAQITNVSSTTLDAPMTFVVTRISSPTVTMLGATGVNTDGQPFVNVPIGANGLAPARAVSVCLRFSNPSRVRFTVTVSVRGIVRPAPTIAAIEPSGLVIAVGAAGTLNLRVANASATDALRITLTNASPNVVSVPTAVVIPRGKVTVSIPVIGRTAGGPVTITASLNGSSATADVSVAPRPPAPSLLGPLRLAHTSSVVAQFRERASRFLSTGAR